MEEDNALDRSCGILTLVIGILGIAMPFTKKPVREAIQLSMTGVGIILSIYSVILRTNNNKQSLNYQTTTNHGQKTD